MVPGGPPCVWLAIKFFPLYITYGGSFSPIADPQARIVIYSLPLPPDVS